MATDSNELGKGGKGAEKWRREEKVGMATDSDRLGGGEGKTLSGRQSMTDDLN